MHKRKLKKLKTRANSQLLFKLLEARGLNLPFPPKATGDKNELTLKDCLVNVHLVNLNISDKEELFYGAQVLFLPYNVQLLKKLPTLSS